MDETNDNSLMKPLVFNSADWDLVQTQPSWHSFHYDWEAGRQIKARLTERGNVWGIGLWPDAETEKVARQCAEIFEEEFGLPNSSLIPDDSVMVLQTRGDGLDAYEAVVALEDTFGCVIDGEKLGKIRENGDVFFKDVVAAVLETRGTKPVKHPPPEPGLPHPKGIAGLGCLALLFIAGWPVGVVVLLGVAASLLIDYFGAGSAKMVMGTAIAAWGVISVLVIRKHGREYVCTNILRFLLSTLAGVYLLDKLSALS